MKRIIACLTFVGVLMLIPGLATAGGKPCSLEGTWYGHNTYGSDYLLTIVRTGAKSYSALVESAQGQFVRGEDGTLTTTWMGYADGPELDFPEGTIVMAYMYGPVEMTGCDSWSAATDWDLYLFEAGEQQDPFEDGVFLFQIPGVVLTYKRMPMSFSPF